MKNAEVMKKFMDQHVKDSGHEHSHEHVHIKASNEDQEYDDEEIQRNIK